MESEIDESVSSIELTQDYTYDNTTDSGLKDGIDIYVNNYVVDGKGHTIDASNQARIFHVKSNNVTFMNLNLINANSGPGGAVYSNQLVIFENVTFIGNNGTYGSAVRCLNATFNNCNFIDNHASNGVILSTNNGSLNISNSNFTNMSVSDFGIVYAASSGELNIDNCIFLSSEAKYATAVYSERKTRIKDSLFEDLFAEITAGAVGFKGEGLVEINDTVFTNTRANKNGGAIFCDFTEKGLYLNNVTIVNASGDFGGAICHLGGYLIIDDSNFLQNTAVFDGGAIYTSFADFSIFNSIFSENKIIMDEIFNGGGIYVDSAKIADIFNTIFINNTNNGVYAYDSVLNVTDCIFEDNGEAIHAVFTDYEINNVTLKNDTFNLNNTDYISVMVGEGKKLDIINNNITVSQLPVRFDSRDWGWVSPVKDQGEMGSCWTFGTCGALESALLKYTGIRYDFSENNMQNSMLQYSKYGIIDSLEEGIREQVLEYVLSWLGVFSSEFDSYDELGKISPLIDAGNETIHIQDAIFVAQRKNFTDINELKKTIIKCGSVTTGYYAFDEAPYFNNDTSAYYQNVSNTTNHAISLVGGDDNYSASNFLLTPPGDGAFIIKNSWGNDSGKNGYYYISYYDISLLNETFAIGFPIENNEAYTKNYQTDFGGVLSYFVDADAVKVTYNSIGNDLISAVGTYFLENENYTFEVYLKNARIPRLLLSRG